MSQKTCHGQVEPWELGGKFLKRRETYMSLSVFVMLAGLLVAETPDTLSAVTVVADRGVVVSRTDTVTVSSSFDAADALQSFPGLYVGDYGGLTGLKSVSLRGLGSAHTAIYVDGIRVGNVQSGQTDLGVLDLASFDNAVIDYAQNSVSFHTARPVFGDRSVAGKVRFRGGSFGTWEPYARLDFRLSPKLSLSAHGSGVFTDGDFPYDGDTKRANNDLKQLRGGVDLFGVMDRGDWQAKVWYNDADRGTPGSLSWLSEDRQKDRNAWAQGMVRKAFSDLYSLQASAKYAYDDMKYLSAWGDSRYEQREFQLNTSHKFQLNEWWSASLAADVQHDRLEATGFSATRTGVVSAAAMAFVLPWMRADVALEYDGAFDKDGLSRNAFSPSADVRVRIAPGLDAVGFARRSYRIPTFNELYYPGYGNADLKPEDAWLTDLGLEYNTALSGKWTLKAKVDGFWNNLTDKIISAPTESDPSIWLPYNVGKVLAKGSDLAAGLTYDDGIWTAGLQARYGFQSALDKTPDSYSYDQQIPYVAKHTVSLAGKAGWQGWLLSAVWNLRSQRRDATGEMPDWNTLDLTLAKPVQLRGCGPLTLSVTARNLTDCRYEVVRGYPMPGRAFYATVEFAF